MIVISFVIGAMFGGSVGVLVAAFIFASRRADDGTRAYHY
jgi:hypothetical protein